MRPFLATVLAACLGWSASVRAEVDPAVIGCAGTFGPLASERTLKETFGDEHVVVREFYSDGLERWVGWTVVFPHGEAFGDVSIWWQDEGRRERPSGVDLYGGARDQAGPAPGSWAWRTTPGARIGMTLAELQDVNGRPFTLKGTDWSNAEVVDWRGGRMAEEPGGCTWSAAVFLKAAPRYDSRHEGPCPVCREMASDDPALQSYGGQVQRLSVRHPQP